jgi:hypothetical protein
MKFKCCICCYYLINLYCLLILSRNPINMKTKFFYLACILLMQITAKAQMKIGDNSTTINSASLLELETTNKGLVFPRVSLTNVTSSSPLPAGLLTGTVVYNTNPSVTSGNGAGLYIWGGSVWTWLATNIASSAWSLTGNSGLNASTNFIGTTDAIDFVAKTNNVERMRILGAASLTGKPGWIGMGITIPRSSLDVTGDYTNKNVLTIQNTSSTGFSSVDMLDNTGALKGTFGYANSGTGGNFASKDYFNSYGSDLLFTANSGSYHLFLKGGTGNIGINTNTPSERLHVVGNFYLNGAFMPGGIAGTSGYVLTSAGAGVSPTWTNPTNFAWSLTGNAGTNYATNFLGTTDNTSLRFRTNNTERMIIDSTGLVGIGSSSFNALNPAKFLVDYGNTTSNAIVNLKGSTDNYFQINLQNKSNGIYSSSDYVATSDDGTDSTFYIDMGINGSNYAPGVENWGGPHDGYLYTYSRNLIIGTQAGGSDVIFLLGGGKVKPNAIMRLNSSDGHVIIGKGEATTSPGGTTLRGPNAQTGSINIAGGSFTVSGGSSTGTATGGALNITGGAATSSGTGGTLNLNGGTSSSGTGGVVLLNTSNTERMRIDALGNVGIANTTPSEKLDVTGNVRFSGALMPNNLAGTSGYLLSSSGTGTSPVWLNPATISSTYAWVLGGNTLSSQQNFGTLNNYPIPFYTNGAERMRITNTGLVGIGTTNPASDLTIFQSSGSGNSKGFTFTGNSIGGTSSGTGFLMSLGYNTTGNKQLWLGDADYAGNASGSFARLVVGGTSFPVLDAVSGNNVSRRYLALGVASDANSGVIFGSDNTNVNPGSQVWDNGNMTIGSGYKSYVAPSNGLLVQGNVGIGTASPSSALSVLAASNPLYLSGVQATGSVSTDSVLTILNGVVKKAPYSSFSSGGSGWSLTGNSGTTVGTNFIGTTDFNGLVFKVNSSEAGYLGISGSSYAVAFGVGSSGSGTATQATAIGSSSQATQQYNTALGYNAQAITSSQATAIGTNSIASGYQAQAFGIDAQATSGAQALALGTSSRVNNQYNIAIGYNAQAITSSQTMAIGQSSKATSYQSIAIGPSAQANTNSQALAIGVSASATGYQSTAIGNSASTTAQNSTVIGNGATTSQSNALILGNTSVNVGIRTSTPSTTAGLDVNANFKLGDVGTVNKNVVSFASTLASTSLAAGTGGTIFYIGTVTFQASSTDVTVTIPSSVNYLTSTRATVTVSPAFDLPAGVSIASARMISTSQMKIRFVNATTDAQTISGSLYVTINEF